jgi:hypothetical protein
MYRYVPSRLTWHAVAQSQLLFDIAFCPSSVVQFGLFSPILHPMLA